MKKFVPLLVMLFVPLLVLFVPLVPLLVQLLVPNTNV